MTSTVEGVRNLIVTKLSALEISTGVPLFGEVNAFATGEFAKYPAVVVRPTGGNGSEIDTHRNERTFSFSIELYQEQSRAGATQSEADSVMVKAADAVLTAFDQDKDLNGEVQIVRVLSYDFNFKIAAGTYNFATFKVDAVVIVPNYN